MASKRFETVEEVHAFFGQHGVKVLSVRIEGDCLAAAVATEADIAIMRAAGLEVVDTHNNLDELAVVFYPTMLLVQR